MTEHIDKQAAIDAINHELLCGSTADACGLETAYDLIHELKPADVRPVVRGKWEHLNWGFDYDRCSVCGYEHRWPSPFYFCPNCGADMRETEE